MKVAYFFRGVFVIALETDGTAAGAAMGLILAQSKAGQIADGAWSDEWKANRV